jgi:hypothetical protein
LELDSDVSVSGPIDGASGTAQGTLEVVNGDVLSRDLGNLEALMQVDVYGDSATFNGTIYSATAMTINRAGLMVLGGSSAQTRALIYLTDRDRPNRPKQQPAGVLLDIPIVQVWS